MEGSRRCKELPEECWELTLNRLALNDYRDLKSPSLVCKQFLSITDRLRHKLVVSHWVFSNNGGEALHRAIQRFQNLKEIELSARRSYLLLGTRSTVDIDFPLWMIASSELNLRSLVLHGLQKHPSPRVLRKLGSTMVNLKMFKCAEWESFGDQDLFAIADALPRLEELDISYPESLKRSVTDAGIEVISRKLPELRKIDISGNRDCSDRSLFALSSTCVNLQVIRCSDCRITADGICFVLRHSPNLISFRAKYLSWSRNSSFPFDDSMNYERALSAYDNHDRPVYSIPERGISLEKLTLWSDYDLTLRGLSSLLHACPSLKYLELWSIRFLNDDSMRDLCRCLPNIESIVLIDCTYLTIATFFILAKECPVLSEIKMESSSQQHGLSETDLDLNSISFDTDLVMNYRIRILNLSNLHFNNELLKKIVVTCPNLHTLIVGGVRLTKAVIRKLSFGDQKQSSLE